MSALPVPPGDSSFWTTVLESLPPELARQAHREQGQPWPQPSLTDYAAYFTDGNRTRYESAIFDRTGRLTRAVVMTLVTGVSTTQGQAWLREVTNGVLLLCEQSTWCWPAHDDTFTKNGWMVPDPAHPYLDLGAGEVAGQLAWIDHVLGAHLDRVIPGLRERVRAEVQTRIFTPFLDRMDWHWLGLHGHVHNWCPWIHSNIAIAAGVFLDQGVVRSEILRRCDEGIGRFWDAVPLDGAIDEGYEYWWNGAARAFEGMDYLRWSGHEPTNFDHEKLRNTLQFPLRMQLSTQWFVNVSDASARPPANQPWQVMFRWGQHLQLSGPCGMAVGTHVRNQRTANTPDANPVGQGRLVEFGDQPGLGRTLLELSDGQWLQAVHRATASPVAPELPLPLMSLFESVDLVLEREREGSSDGLAVSLKGGHNDENHNHNDLGSVTVTLNGTPVIVDAGRKTYEAKTFTDRRYEVWSNTSAWHSAPQVAGREQRAGRNVMAGPLKHVEAGDHSTWHLDLSHAYDLAPGARWDRRVTLDRTQRAVHIRDSWDLGAEPQADQSTVHLMVYGEPRVLDSQTLAVGEAKICHDAAAIAVERVPDPDPLLGQAWHGELFRITMGPRMEQGSLNVTVSQAGVHHER